MDVLQLSKLQQLFKNMTAVSLKQLPLYFRFLTTYLKDFQQCLHIEAPDAK